MVSDREGRRAGHRRSGPAAVGTDACGVGGRRGDTGDLERETSGGDHAVEQRARAKDAPVELERLERELVLLIEHRRDPGVGCLQRPVPACVTARVAARRQGLGERRGSDRQDDREHSEDGDHHEAVLARDEPVEAGWPGWDGGGIGHRTHPMLRPRRRPVAELGWLDGIGLEKTVDM